MKYWTLFFLRMTARAWLSAAVLLWVVSQWVHLAVGVSLGGVYLRPQTNAEVVCIYWSPATRAHLLKFASGYVALDPSEHPPAKVVTDVDISGIGRVAVISHSGFAQIHHWLLTLFFLIATVATSWPRKTKEQRTVEAAAESVKEDET